MADAIDFLRQDALLKRVKGIPGGNFIAWSAKDLARISDQINSTAEKIIRAETTMARKFLDTGAAARRSKFIDAGIVKRAAQPDDLDFLFTISSETVDLAGDVVKAAGIDCSSFNQNPAVLNSHDSSSPPIAISSAPKVSGTSLMAVARFPQTGVSIESDQIVAAVRASLIKGASIGFIPLAWTFSKDPSRPLGIDFQNVRLLEWSTCAIPCNPSALMIGPVSSDKSNRRSRNVPADDVPADDAADWQCCAISSMTIDSTDDPFDPVAAKAALLAKYSPGGTILDDAKNCFFAVDVSAPFIASSYKFPFCRVGAGDVLIASKVGWREAFAALSKSDMPGIVISEAKALVDNLEARLGDVKTADRRREARAIAAQARKIAAAISDAVPLTREQRIAEARAIRATVMAG